MATNTGSGAANLAAMQASGLATATGPLFLGTGAAVMAAMQAAGIGQNTQPAPPNRFKKRVRLSRGIRARVVR